MQPLQRIFNQCRTSLGALPANARLLVGALAVIVLMALLLVSLYAGQRDMLPLGLASASTAVRTDAVMYLDSANIQYEDRGHDIFVPADQRLVVLGRLNEQKIVAVDEINFNSLIDLGSNPFASQNHQRQMLMIAKMNAVKGMLAVRRDVGFVDIVIDEKNGLPGIGLPRIGAVAVVTIEMRGEPMTQDFANAVGHMVAGAQAGLKLEDVTVLDLTATPMKHFKPQAPDARALGGYLDQQRRIEEHYQSRFERFFANVPGAVVTVTAVVRNTRQTTRETTIDDPKIAPISSETRDVETGGGRPNEVVGPGGSPGSNVGARIGGLGRSMPATESMTREERESKFGEREVLVEDDTGYALQVNAVVGVPRSFLLKMFEEDQRRGRVSASADPAVFEIFVEERTAQFEADLAPLIRTDPLDGALPGEVNVWMLPDFDSSFVSAAAGSQSSAGAGVLEAAAGDPSVIRSVGLGALALLSLMMMFLLVRRAGARDEQRPGELPTMRAADVAATGLIGQAREREAALNGVKVDDATLRSQQLLRQINQMVSGGADDAASLIERWVTSNGR